MPQRPEKNFLKFQNFSIRAIPQLQGHYMTFSFAHNSKVKQLFLNFSSDFMKKHIKISYLTENWVLGSLLIGEMNRTKNAICGTVI